MLIQYELVIKKYEIKRNIYSGSNPLLLQFFLRWNPPEIRVTSGQKSSTT